MKRSVQRQLCVTLRKGCSVQADGMKYLQPRIARMTRMKEEVWTAAHRFIPVIRGLEK